MTPYLAIVARRTSPAAAAIPRHSFPSTQTDVDLLVGGIKAASTRGTGAAGHHVYSCCVRREDPSAGFHPARSNAAHFLICGIPTAAPTANFSSLVQTS